MKQKILYLVITILSYAALSAHAESLDITNGLSHNGVTSIIEDTRGYIWVGTYDGLNIYNGNRITVIRNNADTTILRSNRVRALLEDDNGDIWIGSDNGIMIYDYIHNTIRSIDFSVGLYQNSEIVIRIIESSRGEIVALIENGGVAIFESSGILKSYKRLPGGSFNDIVEITPEQYLVTTDNGIYIYNSSSAEYQRVVGKDNDIYETVCRISQDRYAVTTNLGIALLTISIRNNEIEAIEDNERLYDDYRFRAITIDRYGSLWLGTYDNGIAVINDFENVNENLKFISTPPNLRTSYFYNGSNDILWLGSFNKGVIKHSLKERTFKSIMLNNNSDNIYRTWRLFPLDDEHIAIKADNIDFKRYNIFTEECSDLFTSNISDSFSIAISSDSSIWAIPAFVEGNDIYRIKGSNNQKYEIVEDSDDLPYGVPKAMIEDKEGALWVVYAKSIFRLRREGAPMSLKIEKITLPQNNSKDFNSRSLYIDPKDNSLWVPTLSMGLYHITNPEAGRNELNINYYQHSDSDPLSLPSDLASTVMRAKDGSLWVGSEQGGVCKVLEPQMQFEIITPTSGEIANNNIKSILCDSKNRLWIATNNGISRYEISTGKVVNFSTHDGIPTDDISFASTSINDDILLFCGNDRAFMLDANSSIDTDEIPKFHFGQFKLYSRTVEPGQKVDGSVLYNSRFASGDKIKLNHNQNVFSIEIDNLHYGDPINHNIRYKLLPLNREWITHNSTQSVIAFNSLPHGKYELVVEVSNSAGEWSQSKSLQIVITPPLWLMWWAYIIYAILFLAALWIILRVFIRMEGYKHSMEVEALERHNMLEKQRYFSNIAHEIKTPLALIVAPVEALLESFTHDKGVREKLQRINAQSRKMTHLIDVAQSIQLSDAGLLKPQYTIFDFGEFIDTMLDDFKALAKHDKKNIVVNTPTDAVIIKADISMVEKIANNLINNALKYTYRDDTITISWKEKDQMLHFEVSDSGIGISEEDRPHIFERFYRGTNLTAQIHSGTGIGLSFSMRLAQLLGGDISVESRQGEGSTFIVKLPVITDQKPINKITSELSGTESYIYDDEMILKNIEKSQYCDSLIYIVEDNTEMRMMLERIVGRFYNVLCFSNGEQALEAMDKRWPDLLLSDVMMPIMDGYELCQRVKKDIKTCHIPVILLTAFGSNEDKIKGKEFGADLYLVKPFYPKYLITCIETSLSSRAKLRDRFKSGIPTTFSDERQSTQDNKFLERFYALIPENIATEELDLDNFARELGVNRTHFYQKIKNLTGQTPFDLLKEVRLVHAAELLAEGSMTIEEVCINTGFKSRTHFSKLFKNKFGLTPGKYASSIMK